VVDRSGAVQGIMTVERVARLMREGEHGRSFGIFGALPEDEGAAAGAIEGATSADGEAV